MQQMIIPLQKHRINPFIGYKSRKLACLVINSRNDQLTNTQIVNVKPNPHFRVLRRKLARYSQGYCLANYSACFNSASLIEWD